MFSNSNAYQAEVQYRRQQLREDLARRQQVKQAKLARRNRGRRARRRTRLSHQPHPYQWSSVMRSSRVVRTTVQKVSSSQTDDDRRLARRYS